MPNWKKVVTSGSNAELNNIDSSGYIDISGASSDPGADGVVRLGQSSNALRVYTNDGYIQIGPTNSGWAHFYTDRSNYYFNKALVVDTGYVSSYDEDLVLRRDYNDTTYNQITLGDDTYELKLDNTVRHSIDGVGNNTFNGHITASGVISASGGFVGDGSGITNVSATATPAGSDTQVQFNDGGSLGASSILTFGSGKLSSTFLESTRASVMNESGHSSGDFRVEGGGNTHLLFTDASEDAVGIKNSSPTAVLDITGDLRTSTHITASGDISASGALKGSSLDINGSGNVSGDLIIGRYLSHDGDSDTRIAFETNTISLTAGNTTHMGFTQTGGTQILTNITASGNLSASGNVYANNLHVGGVNSSGIGIGGPTQILIGSAQGGPSGSIKFQSANSSITIQQAKDVNGGALTFTNSTGTDIVLIGHTAGTAPELEVIGQISASGFISASSFSGDGSGLSNVSATVADESITLAKLAHAAANTVMVRDANSAGDPSFKAVTNTQILIGDGTGFTAAALSGDVTMTNAGVVSVGDNKIGNDELKQDDDITLQSLTVTNDIDASGDGTFATITMTGKIDTSGEVEAEHLHSTDDIEIGDSLFHSGDTDTKIQFAPDQISFIAGNETLITLTESTQDVVIIGDGGDVDFHVKAGGTNTLFAQGSSNRIGIGTNSPSSKLEVDGDITATSHITASGNISASGTIFAETSFPQFNKFTSGSYNDMDFSHAGDAQGDVVYFGAGSLSAGNMYYLATTGTWTITDASDNTAGADEMLGVALGSNPAVDGVLLRGFVRMAGAPAGSNLRGRAVYMSETAGAVVTTAPSSTNNIIRVCGYLANNDKKQIYFNPSSVWVKHS